MVLRARRHRLTFPRRPLVMGIVNLNDDSFCGDGALDVSRALDLAKGMIAEGADIIDIGAESARTNRGPISVEEEIRRLAPFIEQWAQTPKFLLQRIAEERREIQIQEPETRNQEPLLS